MMKIETSFDHVWLVRDHHVGEIVSTTGAGIRCPDVSNLKEPPKKYSIWIRGSMDAVYFASDLLSVSRDPHVILECNFRFYFYLI